MSDAKYRDKYGIMHHRVVKDGDPLTSENGPLFDGTNIVAKALCNQLWLDDAYAYVKRCYTLSKYGWKASPDSDSEGFSHDNWKGVFMGLEICERLGRRLQHKKLIEGVKLVKSTIPFFHSQMDHPRDFLLVVGFKIKLLRPFTMWASKLAGLVTAIQTHKTKHDTEIAKTDGKIMGFGLCVAFGWNTTLMAMSYSIRSDYREFPMPRNAWKLCRRVEHEGHERWQWVSWYNVFMDYYNDENHPTVKLIGTFYGK